jgi:NtrC-family two-component system sensor histidine kinase KinB
MHFELFKKNHEDSSVILKIRGEIFKIMEINMSAIQRKSETAKATADNAVYWIVITALGCFLIAFILLVNLPANIANPIKELTGKY